MATDWDKTAKERIVEYLGQRVDAEFYASDVAEALGLSYGATLAVLDELHGEGRCRSTGRRAIVIYGTV